MPSSTQMARSTAQISSCDKVAGLDLSLCLSKVAIWSPMVKGRKLFKSVLQVVLDGSSPADGPAEPRVRPPEPTGRRP